MEKDIISRGAEAVLIKEGDRLIKRRVSKGYRVKDLDKKIRKYRTRSEARLLSKLDFVPKVINYDDTKMEIEMEFIEGDLVRDILDNLDFDERKRICFEIGEKIGKMHDLDIIHGDLTTSNFIVKVNHYRSIEKEIVFIDFGLGFVSKRKEDKATDLRLLRQAFESKHFNIFGDAYKNILDGYKNSKNSEEVLEWLEKRVEQRGRYKRKSRKTVA